MELKPVIIIGGTAGVGKTALSKKLSKRYDFDHRIGTGFIREILRSVISTKDNIDLHSFTFRPANLEDLFQHYHTQCQIITNPTIACINRAKREGTSLIIEGSNIIPSLISPKIVDLFLILKIADEKDHRTFLSGESHKYRKVTDNDFKNIRLIQEYILKDAVKFKEPQLIIAENSVLESTSKYLARRMRLLFERKSDECFTYKR